MPGKNCAIAGSSISRKYKGISIFKVSLANNEFYKKWSQDLINIILKYRQRDKSLNKRIESHKLFICEKRFTADQICVYSSRKSLKEGALPTLNLPWPSGNATNSRSTSAIEGREEYSFLQAQLPQPQPSNVYKFFDKFKLHIKSLALNKLREINIQEQLVIVWFTSSEYILPTYEIYINNLLNFTVRVHSWILPVDHELHLSCNSSFLNVAFSTFVERSSQFTLCQGIKLPDSRKEISFVKHVLPKKFNYFDYINTDVKQQVHQDEYFRSNSCALLLSSDNPCKFVIKKTSDLTKK